MLLKSIGLMSGTSMDGIDATLLESDGEFLINPISSLSLHYDKSFKLALREQELLVRQAKENITSLDVIQESTKLHAQLVNDLLSQANLKSTDVDVIGYHGQTLYHNPQEAITIQIGNGQLLANLTGINVVNDFRSKDIAHGGQGAPLAPIYHHALAIKDNYFPVAIVNCGGIANITLIQGLNQVQGFDTGPGNVLLDSYIRKKTNNTEFMDFNGKYGLKGEVNISVLKILTAKIQPYLNLESPKSLDSGAFELIPELDDLSIYDACATLAYFTSKCIVDSLSSIDIPTKWILAGGGWNNPTIVKYLKEILTQKIGATDIKTASEIGWDSDYMEAEIFAYLAIRNLKNLPTSLPQITGAKVATIGGNIYYPQK